MIYKIVCAGDNHFESLYKKEDDEVIIAVDGGFSIVQKMNLKVESFFGDCDSLSSSYKELLKNVKANLYKKEKDQTDLELALEYVLSRYQKDDTVLIYNATGKRLDHYEGALRILKKYSKFNIAIIDKDNYISIYQNCGDIIIEKDDYKYISIFNIYPDTVITLNGFKYQLDNYQMKEHDCLCISNEVISKGIINTNKDIMVIKSK